jgi:hypothetical protein
MAKEDPASIRQDHELPYATARDGWRYHHLGVPTDTPRPGEQYLEQYKMYVPHIAFEVDDLDAALVGKRVLAEPSSPSAEVRVAMIIDDGAPVELLEFRKAR